MKLAIYLIMVILLAGAVMGLNCTQSITEFKPTDSLYYICEDVNATECFSYIYLENGTGGLINARPLVEHGISGSQSGFTVINTEAIIDFSTKDLRPNYAYTFGVVCGPDRLEFNRTLSYKSFGAAPRAGIFIKQNALYIALGLVLGGLALGAILFLINAVKYKGQGILDVIDNIFFRRGGG